MPQAETLPPLRAAQIGWLLGPCVRDCTNKIHPAAVHVQNGFAAGEPSIDYDLLGQSPQLLVDAIHRRVQLPPVTGGLAQPDSDDDSLRGVSGDLHIVGRSVAA